MPKAWPAMKYQVLHDINHEHLVERVNVRIQEGWEPLGGVSVCPEPDSEGAPTTHLLYSQAIIKR
jgi:hypothetical protein